MGRFVNPFTDYGFKLLFGELASKSILIEFLNDLLEGERHIRDIKYLKNEELPQNVYGRGVIFDILCESDTGEKFIVEIQNKGHQYLKERFIFYMAKAITKQSKKGKDWDFALYPVYGIFLLNFTVPELRATLRSDVAYMDMQTHEIFSDCSRLTFLQMPYFTKSEEECVTNMDKWFYILRNMETLERMPWAAQKAAFERLMERAEIANFTPEEEAQYEAQLDLYRVMNGAMERNRLEGIEEGERIGMKRGERKEKIKMACRLKELGVDYTIISQSSGLSIQEIEKL